MNNNSPASKNLPINRTYTITLQHVAMLTILSRLLDKNQSEIVREALDDYFEKHRDGAEQAGLLSSS